MYVVCRGHLLYLLFCFVFIQLLFKKYSVGLYKEMDNIKCSMNHYHLQKFSTSYALFEVLYIKQLFSNCDKQSPTHCLE